MKLQMYVIFDSKALVYNRPFYLPNDDVALRTAKDLRQDPNSEAFKNPEDYTLFHIGSYDDENAEITTLPTPQPLIRFNELKENDS